MKAGLKRWRVLINGSNFRMPFEADGGDMRVRRVGFHTSVFVVARTAREAELKAVDCLRNDRKLQRSVRNPPGDHPLLFAEIVEEIPSFRGCKRPRSGLGFYFERGPKRKR